MPEKIIKKIIGGKKPGVYCNHCGEYLGIGDSYDLMKNHIHSCPGKIAKAYRRAIENDEWGDDSIY